MEGAYLQVKFLTWTRRPYHPRPLLKLLELGDFCKVGQIPDVYQSFGLLAHSLVHELMLTIRLRLLEARQQYATQKGNWSLRATIREDPSATLTTWAQRNVARAKTLSQPRPNLLVCVATSSRRTNQALYPHNPHQSTSAPGCPCTWLACDIRLDLSLDLS